MRKCLPLLVLLSVLQSGVSAATQPVITKVPTFDEKALAAKLIANAVNKQETQSNQQDIMNARQVEVSNKRLSLQIEQQKLQLEQDKLAFEHLQLQHKNAAMNRQIEKQANESVEPAQVSKPNSLLIAVQQLRLASIMTLPSGELKAIFYQDKQRLAYFQGDHMLSGAQLIKVAPNGVAIQVDEEVIFKYIN